MAGSGWTALVLTLAVKTKRVGGRAEGVVRSESDKSGEAEVCRIRYGDGVSLNPSAASRVAQRPWSDRTVVDGRRGSGRVEAPRQTASRFVKAKAGRHTSWARRPIRVGSPRALGRPTEVAGVSFGRTFLSPDATPLSRSVGRVRTSWGDG